MVMPEFVPRTFAELAESLRAAENTHATADEVVKFALAELDADHGGITLIPRKDVLETVAPSAPVVAQIADLQNELNEGPCRDSAWNDQTLVSQDLTVEQRWPRWAPKAAACGIRSVLAAELTDVHGGRVGAINLYWENVHSVTREDIAFAQIAARHAAVALVSSMNEANLHTALDTRKQIGVAQGILMERYELDLDQAFALLRRYSQDYNLKLRDVATIVIDTRELPSGDEPHE